MELPRLLQLISALLLAASAIWMFVQGDQPSGRGRARQAAVLFTIAALINFALFAGVFS